MARRQHHRGKKRPKNWHRGKGEGRRAEAAQRRLPDLGTGADPTSGEPTPIRRRQHPGRAGRMDSI